jgi:hypothetical protein
MITTLNEYLFKELNSIRQLICDSLIKINDYLESWMTRDNFTEKTKKDLAMRVNYMCSNPTCTNFTIKPHSTDPNKWEIIGEAAHIKAASSGGMRSDPNMKSEERISIDNGIWLCPRCHKIIDSEPEWATVELLQNWKRNAELRALNNSIDEDKKQLILYDLNEAIKKINSFIYEYESNDPAERFWKELTSPYRHAIFDQSHYEYNKFKEDYSSKKLLEYNKNLLPDILDVLFKCQIVLGESDEYIVQAFTKFKISSLDINLLKDSIKILHKLKSVISWR